MIPPSAPRPSPIALPHPAGHPPPFPQEYKYIFIDSSFKQFSLNNFYCQIGFIKIIKIMKIRKNIHQDLDHI